MHTVKPGPCRPSTRGAFACVLRPVPGGHAGAGLTLALAGRRTIPMFETLPKMRKHIKELMEVITR